MPSASKPKSSAKPAAKATAKAPAKTAAKAPATTQAPKPATRPAKVPARPAELPDSVSAVVAEAVAAPAGKPAKADETLRLKALVDQISASGGMKKPEVKTVVEAALTLIGTSLATGGGFNLPGLGRGRVSKRKPSESGEVLTVKLKRGAEKNANTPLAPADD